MYQLIGLIGLFLAGAGFFLAGLGIMSPPFSVLRRYSFVSMGVMTIGFILMMFLAVELE